MNAFGQKISAIMQERDREQATDAYLYTKTLLNRRKSFFDINLTAILHWRIVSLAISW
jgi:hypothetical protein